MALLAKLGWRRSNQQTAPLVVAATLVSTYRYAQAIFGKRHFAPTANSNRRPRNRGYLTSSNETTRKTKVTKKSQSSNKVLPTTSQPKTAKLLLCCATRRRSRIIQAYLVSTLTLSLTLSPLLPSSKFGHSLLFRRRGESSLPSPPQKSLIEICPFWSFLLRASAPLA